MLVWPAGTQRGAASGHLQTAEPMRLVIYLARNGPVDLRINGESVELTVGPRGQLATATIPSGESVITLEATLGGATRARAVSVEIFAEPLTEGTP